MSKINNNGITLIALVITIIVLIILAGVAISMLSGDNGILNQAAEAREQTEQESTAEQVRLAVTTSMINENHKVDPGTLKTELSKIEGVTVPDGDITLPYNLEVDGQTFNITENGLKEQGPWYYTEDKKITNGEITIEIGDTVNYDATNGGTLSDDEYYYESLAKKNGNSDQIFTVSAASGLTWKVLGVEKGQILIMPTENLKTGGKNNNGNFYLGPKSSSDLAGGQNAYVNAVNELDSISGVGVRIDI